MLVLSPRCEIHIFYGTLNVNKLRRFNNKFRERNIHFHAWNIVAECDEGVTKFPSKCVAETLKTLNHEKLSISWFKIDCEGCEHTVMPKFFYSSVQIDEIMIEVHDPNATSLEKLFRTLRDADMMMFHKERNHWGCQGYSCVEYSFISQEHARRVLHNYLSAST